MTQHNLEMPDKNGYIGEYGGQIIPPGLVEIMCDINDAYDTVSQAEDFQQELAQLNADYIGRSSPISCANRLSEKIGAQASS